MRSTNPLFLYYAFALVAVGLNVLVQHLVFISLTHSHAIFIAMLIGAAVALVAKYFLDRKFVFLKTSSANRRELFWYALTGGLITIVFFVAEYVIWDAYKTGLARDIGIVVGMLLGYTLKYFIDKHLVFSDKHLKMDIWK